MAKRTKKPAYGKPKMSGELGGGALDDVVGGAECAAGKRIETCGSGYGAADACEHGPTWPKDCRVGGAATTVCRHGLQARGD